MRVILLKRYRAMADIKSFFILWVSFLVGTLLDSTEALVCDCTEQECLSDGLSASCIGDPQLGCYKQYYKNENPQIIMGCVQVLLTCNMLKPPGYPSEQWPDIKCCRTDHCNRHLNVSNKNRSTSSPVTERSSTTAWHLQVNITNSTFQPNGMNALELEKVNRDHFRLELEDQTRAMELEKANQEQSDADDTVHPVLVLLIVLALVFIIVAIASVSVIIRIWLYRKQTAKRSNLWSCQLLQSQQNRLLVSLPAQEGGMKSDTTSSSTLTSTFDVP